MFALSRGRIKPTNRPASNWDGFIAQSLEHRPDNPKVMGWIPVGA